MNEPFFDEPEETSSSSSHEGLPSSTVILALLCVAFVGGATFLTMRWTGAQKNTVKLRDSIVLLTEEEAELTEQATLVRTQYKELKGRTDVLYNGKMEICNESTRDVRISKIAATFLNDNGDFETFNSEPYGTRIWTVIPGERKELSFLQGNVAWDGSVVYYSALLRGADGQEYPFGGMWPPNDSKCLKWTMTF